MGLLERILQREPKPPGGLTAEQRAHWDANGFLVLRGFMRKAELKRVEAVVDDEWSCKPNDHEVDVLTGPHAGCTFRMGDAPREARREVYKLNNLFARRPEIRGVALAPRLRAVLADLLEGEPMICNSLNFERGSQQTFHIDTWYMPPPVDDRMVVASIALDDVGPDNGPLVYYPGSNRIPPYRFSHGRQSLVEAEAGRCWDYLNAQIKRLGLEPEEFRGKRGDVFLWHARLLHGGRPIRDMAKTRRTLVVHYWRAGDLPAGEVRVDPAAGSYLGRTLRGEITF
jgi:phytanoyl-CoA hydroxylase